ncbi:MAG: ergothioneine biosynthesis protein EgtB [Gammaproteobacteria bacterium]|jgi:ergothioneine biosynthesis protein EgtB|nr:ergothioneine biosynthesis protein EgtB [Gammaproteobacteria bacterium]
MTELTDQLRDVRARTEALCAGLSAEDCNLQAMPDTSPAKWHLAHTTWFFDTFVLQPFEAGYRSAEPAYAVLFNSYYNGIGEQYPRAQRGLLSRPGLDEVLDYRADITARVTKLLQSAADPAVLERVELGLHHEAQHQELLLTDLKYSFFQNPLFPKYTAAAAAAGTVVEPQRFVDYPSGTMEIGAGDKGFAFDNERPRHAQIVPPFRLAQRLTTNAEYLDFVADGGYSQPEYWLADGWQTLKSEGWRHPLYWGRIDGEWFEYTLAGLQPLNPAAPVAHLSLFEASAYAAWAGKRLPTELEWETAAGAAAVTGNFAEQGSLHPEPAQPGATQLFGDCWEWCNSAYLPYPGFRVAAGAVGEYNGKFMSSQFVLRGGSCLSAQFHIRPTYRNFFYAPDRWQCTGIRLAESV